MDVLCFDKIYDSRRYFFGFRTVSLQSPHFWLRTGRSLQSHVSIYSKVLIIDVNLINIHFTTTVTVMKCSSVLLKMLLFDSHRFSFFASMVQHDTNDIYSTPNTKHSNTPGLFLLSS
jgi:hypothetical protein